MNSQIWACEAQSIQDYFELMTSIDDDKVQSLNFSSITDNRPSILRVENDTAYVKIHGQLSRSGPSPLAQIFGIKGTSYGSIVDALRTASDDLSVETIVLEMDTPGGEVAGVDQVYTAVKNAAETKRVIAVNQGMIASAGYWIAAGCDKIYGMSPTVETGSIGVVIVQIDTSKRDEKAGIKRVTILSPDAPNKNPDANTEKGFKTLQERAAAIERVFIQRVAKGRRLPVETVKQDFGRGGVLIAQDPDDKKPDAISVGMIDGLIQRAEIGETMEIMSDMIKSTSLDNPAPKGADEQPMQEERMETLAQMVAENPHLKSELERLKLEEFTRGVESVKAQVKEYATYLGPESTYPDEIKKLAAKAMTGEIAQDVFRGMVAAIDILNAKKTQNEAIEESNAQEATPAQQPVPLSDDGIVRTYEDFRAAVRAQRIFRGEEVE